MRSARAVAHTAATTAACAGLLAATVATASVASAAQSKTGTVTCPQGSEVLLTVDYNPGTQLTTKVLQDAQGTTDTLWSRTEPANALVGGNGFQDRVYATGVVAPVPLKRPSTYKFIATVAQDGGLRSVTAQCI